MENHTLFTHRPNPVWSTFVCFCLFATSLFADVNGDGKTVICFVGHKTSHGFGNHEYAAGNHLIEELLQKAYPDKKIEGRHAIPWPENEEEFYKDADCVVFFCSGGGGHVVNNHVPEFDKVMRTGAGLVCLHYGVEVPIGPSAKGMLAWMGGYFEKNWSVNPHWVAEFKSFSDHPAANGVKPFQADDEWYFHMRFVEGMKGVEPILSAVAPDETMKRPDGPHSGNPTVRKAVAEKKPQHVAWAYQRGENYNDGRGYGFTGLHYHWNWEEDNFRKTVLNGVAWTCKLAVPENGVESSVTREYLEENAKKWGGDQTRKKKPAPKKKAASVNPNAKPIFESKPVENGISRTNEVAIEAQLPKEAKDLFLAVDDLGSHAFDWANWGDAVFVMADGTETKLVDLDWKSAEQGWGQTRKNLNAGGKPMQVLGKPVAHGIGTHAPALTHFEIPKGAVSFKARGAIDDGGANQNGGAPAGVKFLIYTENPGLPKSVSSSSNQGGGDPADAISTLTVHPDLDVQLFASEPMIGSPSSIDIDAQGRVWVCDVVNYRRNQGKREGGDKIMILEDTDGDAKADKSTVFYQGHDVDSAHGICVLGDRVIISSGEEIFSLYDRDGDDQADPDSKEMMFTNIGGKQHDHGIHAVHFGPDGRLYFNFGNAGQRLCDPEGNEITDINGVKLERNRPFQEGMVFRCDLNGENVELLGWNFRNNWEACVDSFGTIWQSDNDDDGNKGVRINYVMEYGNYGYKDEITGAGWRDARVGIEEEIPDRHWHLNDPGVVPNLIQTGAGSPTGICVYEGKLLPEIFHNQVIHCDAGPNVVRAYVREKDGAGYQAKMVNILEGTSDKWFRPSDVCVAPDGSLFVADWYDPGVGGHGMRDIEKGRIYRVIPKGQAKKYSPTNEFAKLTSGEKPATSPLYTKLAQSPNMAERFLIWNRFDDPGTGFLDQSTKRIEEVYQEMNTASKARLIWFTTSFFGDKNPILLNALDDEEPELRISAIRAWRQIWERHRSSRLAPYQAVLTKMAKDPDPQVRREVAVALRFHPSKEADQIWATLAEQYDGKDRWYLEALGIGADLHWDSRLAALRERPHPDIIWRSRGSDSANQIAEILITSKDSHARFLRGLDFQPNEQKARAYETVFSKGGAEAALVAAGKIGRAQIDEIDGGPERLEKLLDPIRGKAEFVTLADRLNLRGFEPEISQFIVDNPDAAEAVIAAKILMRDQGKLRNMMTSPDATPQRVSAIVSAVGRTNDRSIGGLLGGLLRKHDTPLSVRRSVIDALAISSNGGRELIKIASEGKLSDSLKTTAALAIARSPDQRLRNEAKGVLGLPKAAGADSFPTIAEMAKLKGDTAKGKEAFTKATCSTCHQVTGEGIAFGPDLSQIGTKLSREAMFEAILYPSAAISHGYHGMNVTKKDGTALVGYITGDTDAEIQLQLPGGVAQGVPKKEITQSEELEVSLMPPGLAAIVGQDGLIDLVEYLLSLQ